VFARERLAQKLDLPEARIQVNVSTDIPVSAAQSNCHCRPDLRWRLSGVYQLPVVGGGDWCMTLKLKLFSTNWEQFFSINDALFWQDILNFVAVRIRRTQNLTRLRLRQTLMLAEIRRFNMMLYLSFLSSNERHRFACRMRSAFFFMSNDWCSEFNFNDTCRLTCRPLVSSTALNKTN
jgi:hypothetical protein